MNVLFIGLGSIARKHIKALNSLGESVNLYALRSGTNNNSIEGVQDIYSWNEVPVEISFAVVSSPTHQHLTALQECVKRNVPVFIEKPISDSLDGLEALAASMKERNLVSYVACNLRFLPVLIFLKKELDGKRINELTAYCGSSLPDWRPGTDYRQSYSADEKKGGGVHMDLFHEIDYLVWIFKLPSSSKGVVRSRSSLDINAADFAHYQLFYEQFTAMVTLNYYRKDPRRMVEIVFDNTTWQVDLLRNTIYDSAGEKVFEDREIFIGDTYKEQMRYFIDCLHSGKPIENDFHSSLEILKLALHYEKVN